MPSSPISCVSVIGFGLMGAQIAQVFAQAGFKVKAFDSSREQLDSGFDLIRNGKHGLERSVAKGKMNPEDAKEVVSRISPTVSIGEACVNADMVLEAAVEQLQTKIEIFQRTSSALGPEAIMATNTSTLSIKKISASFPKDIRERLVGMHFFNPPQVMKLVELVKTNETSGDVISRLRTLTMSMRKTPIVVMDIPGFVANRIGISVFAEASSLLEKGVASVRDIDLAMKLGYGYPMGPFELGDLVGLDSRLRNMQGLYTETQDERFKPPRSLENLVKAGYLGDPKTKRGSKGGYYDYFGLKRPSEES